MPKKSGSQRFFPEAAASKKEVQKMTEPINSASWVRKNNLALSSILERMTIGSEKRVLSLHFIACQLSHAKEFVNNPEAPLLDHDPVNRYRGPNFHFYATVPIPGKEDKIKIDVSVSMDCRAFDIEQLTRDTERYINVWILNLPNVDKLSEEVVTKLMHTKFNSSQEICIPVMTNLQDYAGQAYSITSFDELCKRALHESTITSETVQDYHMEQSYVKIGGPGS